MKTLFVSESLWTAYLPCPTIYLLTFWLQPDAQADKLAVERSGAAGSSQGATPLATAVTQPDDITQASEPSAMGARSGGEQPESSDAAGAGGASGSGAAGDAKQEAAGKPYRVRATECRAAWFAKFSCGLEQL